MTLKDERKDLQNLLNATTGVNLTPQQDTSTSTTSPIEEIEAEPLFEFDWDAENKKIRKRARQTVKKIVELVVPKEMQGVSYIEDKMEQDEVTLTGLYTQQRACEVMQRSIVESTAKGNNAPRMYEVFGQLSEKLMSINKQIIATETQLRKTYIDLKSDYREKQADEKNTLSQPTALPNSSSPNNYLAKGTKDLISACRMQMMNTSKKENVEDVDFTNIETPTKEKKTKKTNKKK